MDIGSHPTPVSVVLGAAVFALDTADGHDKITTYRDATQDEALRLWLEAYRSMAGGEESTPDIATAFATVRKMTDHMQQLREVALMWHDIQKHHEAKYTRVDEEARSTYQAYVDLMRYLGTDSWSAGRRLEALHVGSCQACRSKS